MTERALIRAISETSHPELLKAQCIGIIREIMMPPEISLDRLLELCAQAVGTTVAAAKSPSRKRVNVRARMLFVFHIHKHNFKMFSLDDIGRYIGNRDHTTIIHNRETAYDLEATKDDLFLMDLRNLYTLTAGGSLPAPPVPEVQKPKTRPYHYYYDSVEQCYYPTLEHIGKKFKCRYSAKDIRKKFGSRFKKIQGKFKNI